MTVSEISREYGVTFYDALDLKYTFQDNFPRDKGKVMKALQECYKKAKLPFAAAEEEGIAVETLKSSATDLLHMKGGCDSFYVAYSLAMTRSLTEPENTSVDESTLPKIESIVYSLLNVGETFLTVRLISMEVLYSICEGLDYDTFIQGYDYLIFKHREEILKHLKQSASKDEEIAAAVKKWYNKDLEEKKEAVVGAAKVVGKIGLSVGVTALDATFGTTYIVPTMLILFGVAALFLLLALILKRAFVGFFAALTMFCDFIVFIDYKHRLQKPKQTFGALAVGIGSAILTVGWTLYYLIKGIISLF